MKTSREALERAVLYQGLYFILMGPFRLRTFYTSDLFIYFVQKEKPTCLFFCDCVVGFCFIFFFLYFSTLPFPAPPLQHVHFSESEISKESDNPSVTPAVDGNSWSACLSYAATSTEDSSIFSQGYDVTPFPSVSCNLKPDNG